MFSDIFNEHFSSPCFTPIFTQENEKHFLQSISNLRPLIFACINADDILEDPFALYVLSLADSIAPSDLAIELWDKKLKNIINKGTDLHEQYNVTSRCDEILKLGYEFYQKNINPKTRKLSGQWFTPSPVISYMTKSIVLLYEEKFGSFDKIPGRILEPCCGVGSFVVALLPYFESNIRSIEEGTILACEIDPVAAFLARLNISSKCFELGSNIPFENIMCINTLDEGLVIT